MVQTETIQMEIIQTEQIQTDQIQTSRGFYLWKNIFLWSVEKWNKPELKSKKNCVSIPIIHNPSQSQS